MDRLGAEIDWIEIKIKVGVGQGVGQLTHSHTHSTLYTHAHRAVGCIITWLHHMHASQMSQFV